MPLVRLDAEALYDSLLLVAGRLDETRFGPPTPSRSRADGLVTPAGDRPRLAADDLRAAAAQSRCRRTWRTFDFPQMNPNCIERRDSTVAPQALHLMNNGMVQQLAEQFAQRVLARSGRPIRPSRSSGFT